MRFVKSSFLAFQNQGLNSKSWAVIQQVALASQIPSNLPSLVLNYKEVISKDLTDLILLCKALKVTNTPCVCVEGTYTVTPEFVQGADPSMFNQLVNSVISMSIGT